MELAIKIFQIVQVSLFNTFEMTWCFYTKRCLTRVAWFSFANTIYMSFAYKSKQT